MSFFKNLYSKFCCLMGMHKVILAGFVFNKYEKVFCTKCNQFFIRNKVSGLLCEYTLAMEDFETYCKNKDQFDKFIDG